MHCPVCNYSNSSTNRFCSQCGASLSQESPVETCLGCGAVLLPDSKFCGQCGHRRPPAGAEGTERDGGDSAPGIGLPSRAGEKGAPAMASALSLSADPMDDGDSGPSVQTLLAEKAVGLSDQMTSAYGERRDLTVLFVSIDGFKQAEGLLDSEDIYLVTDEAVHLMVQAVDRFQGMIDKFTSTGIMALFGVPVAQENDPERAVRAALAMLEGVRNLQERCRATMQLEFQVRIGINTGKVIAGSLGSDLHMEYTVIGNTVNLASRLEGLAEPGAIFVSFSTYHRTRAFFDYRTLPPVSIKGIPEPVRAYQPLGLRAKPDRARGLMGLHVPMVGRRELLEELVQIWRSTCSRHSRQIGLITGEAGLGKSRLVAEFRQQLPPGDRIFQGDCLNYTRATPFWVINQLLRVMMGLNDWDEAERQQEQVAQYLHSLDLAAAEMAPYLLYVLGIPQPSNDLARRVAMMDPAMLQQQIHSYLQQLFRAEAQRSPFVLIFEDIHWIDGASRGFLVELLRFAADLPICFLLVSREYERNTVVQPVISVLEADEDWYVDIRLTALSPDQEYQLIDRLLAEVDVTLPSIHQHIAARAEGNPFYIEEIVRMLLDRLSQGQETGPDGDMTAEAEMDAETLMASIPDSLVGLILTRFDSLDEHLRSAMQFAAAIGRSFSVPLLQILLQVNEEVVLEMLAGLVERQFLVEEQGAGQMVFSFRHVLVQEAVYETLLRKSKRQIHGAVAAALRDNDFLPQDERTEALAYHFSHAEEPELAIPYYVDAATSATRRSAYETSAQHYRRGLALYPEPPAAFSQTYAQIYVGLGSSLKYSGLLEESGQILEQGLDYLRRYPLDQRHALCLFVEALRELADVSQRAGNFVAARGYMDEALAVAAPVKHTPLWYTLIERMAWIQFRLGEIDEGARLARQAIQELESDSEPQPFTLASLYNTLGGVEWQQGNLADALVYVEGSLKLYEPVGFSWGISVACANLGVLNWTLGRWATGTEWYERAAKIQEENGFRYEHATSLRNLGYLRMAQGDSEIAYHHFERSLAICEEQNYAYGSLATHLALGFWAVEMGDGDEMDRQVEAARTYAESSDTENRILLDLLTAQSFGFRGDYGEAMRIAKQALRLAIESGLQAEVLDANQVLGQLFAKVGDLEASEEYLLEALRLAQERQAPDRIANAQLELASLAEWHIYQGGEKKPLQEQGLTRVRAAIAAYERLGARPQLRRARALEERLVNISDPAQATEDANRQPPRTGDAAFAANARSWSEDGAGMVDGERARVTVLWLNVDVKGIRDEEEQFHYSARLLAIVGRIVKQSGGYLIRRSGGAAASFGAPIPCEDGPVRAVRCAASLADYLRKQADRADALLHYSIGIDHGEAVVGYLDPQSRSHCIITGDPMTGAETLADWAPPETIWLTDHLAGLTGRSFLVRPVLPPEDSGYGPDEVLEFISTAAHEHWAYDKNHRAKLIGREPLLSLLYSRVEGLKQGESGFVWLQGEAGMGKSRLLADFYQRLSGEPLHVWRGACLSQNTQQPFTLFSSLLRDIFGLSNADTPEEHRENLQAGLERIATNRREVQPYLELLCGIAPAEADAQRLAALEPEALRQQIFVAVRTLLVGMVQQRPLLLMLDDLHWIDPMSAALLAFLAQMAASMPVLFILAHRPFDGQISPSNQNELDSIRNLYLERTWQTVLPGLTRDEGRQLLAELLPSGKLALDAYRFILDRSDGNPYYMEEFLRLLIEQHYLQDEDGVWRTRADRPLKDLPLPDSLDSLIRSRVDSLTNQQRQLLQVLAVIGHSVSASLLSRTMQDEVDEQLHELSRRGLLTSSVRNREWRFSHHIAQIAVYNSLLRVRLKALHLQVANALEEEWGTNADEHPEEMAHHLMAAEEPRRALHYLVLAGDRAEARYANEEALSYYQKARTILQEEMGLVADELRWRVIVGLGDTYRFMGQYALSMEALEEGLSLLSRDRLTVWQKAGIFRRMGQTCALQGRPEEAYDHFRQALVALEEPEDLAGQTEAARTLYFLTYAHFRRGQWEKAKETCEMCYIYAEKTGDLSELAAAENLRGGIAYAQGERVLAMQHTANAMDLRERIGYTWGVASTLGNLAIVAGENGDWEQARRYFLRSLQLRQDLGDIEGVAIVYNNLGWLCRVTGELDRAESYFQECLKVAEPFKMIYHAANATLGIGHIRQLHGDIEQAQRCIRSSVDLAEQVDAQGLLSEIYRVQADILLAEGNPEEAEESARWAVLLATENNSAPLEADAWRVVSECQHRQRQTQRALETIGRARQAQPEGGDTIECGRIALQTGRLLEAAGRVEEAILEFDEAHRILSAIGAGYELAQLEATRHRILS